MNSLYFVQLGITVPLFWLVYKVNRLLKINPYINGFSFSIYLSFVIRGLRLITLPTSDAHYVSFLTMTYLPILSTLFFLSWFYEVYNKLKPLK